MLDIEKSIAIRRLRKVDNYYTSFRSITGSFNLNISQFKKAKYQSETGCTDFSVFFKLVDRFNADILDQKNQLLGRQQFSEEDEVQLRETGSHKQL